MNHLFYEYALCAALSLMLFFGFYFLFARISDKTIFKNYLRSRRMMGTALLILSANYSIHLFCGIRFTNIHAAILINLSTYFLCYWLFSAALTSLLNRFYLTKRRLAAHLTQWFLFTILAWTVLHILPQGDIQKTALILMATWLFAYGFWLARRLILTYHRAVRAFDNTHSDNIAVYIRWMSIFTYWAVIFGVSCGLLTFLPDQYIFLWILSSIPFYIYLFCSYLNYLLFYEQVERILEMNIPDISDTPQQTTSVTPQFYDSIRLRLDEWIRSQGFTQSGFTIEDLARTLNTNRTYLSTYINQTFHMTFRDWITSLRLEYARQMLIEHPELNISQISEASGFLSLSYFSKIFTEKEGISPTRWRKQ